MLDIYRRSIFWWLGALKRERTEKWANLEGVSKRLRTNQRAGILISCEMKLYWWESRGKRNEFTGSFHRLERIWRGKNQTHIFFSIYCLNTSSILSSTYVTYLCATLALQIYMWVWLEPIWREILYFLGSEQSILPLLAPNNLNFCYDLNNFYI